MSTIDEILTEIDKALADNDKNFDIDAARESANRDDRDYAYENWVDIVTADRFDSERGRLVTREATYVA